ncbi:MAG: hypothetical protein FWE42_06085, partial [Defluviitaleaceae bacterium]|nr:hypothetical protein [Defluviitaleaceae bacterium]
KITSATEGQIGGFKPFFAMRCLVNQKSCICMLPSSLRVQGRNPIRAKTLDCFIATLFAMTG